MNRKAIKNFLRIKKISPRLQIKVGVDRKYNIVEFLELYNEFLKEKN